MGTTADEPDWENGERPARLVSIDQPLAIMKYEVTVGEFRRFIQASGEVAAEGCYGDKGLGSWTYIASASWMSPGFVQASDEPVACVSWDDATAYARWLSKETGQHYRLPTEIEWEYAAKADMNTADGGASDVTQLCSYMNGVDVTASQNNPAWETIGCNDGHAFTAPVGSYSGNAFGVFDMLGNVWEWTADCYEEERADEPTVHVDEFVDEVCSMRVVRGGSWTSLPSKLSTSARVGNEPEHSMFNVGFRLVRVL